MPTATFGYNPAETGLTAHITTLADAVVESALTCTLRPNSQVWEFTTTAAVGTYLLTIKKGSVVLITGLALRVTSDAAIVYDGVGAALGASATVNVLPGYITRQKAQQNNELFVGVGSLTQQALTCFNTDGTAQNLSGLTLRFCVSVEDSTAATGEAPVAQIENANITVSGTNNNVATFRYTAAMVATPRRLIWSLRSDPNGNNVELQKGVLNVGVSADA